MRKIYILIFTLFGLGISFGQNQNQQLYDAVLKNDFEKTETLLKDNADADFVISKGSMKINLLITAVNNENLEIVKKLIEYKADVNWRDGFNSTALMYAAAKGNYAITNYLIENGADVNAQDGQGNSVLSASLESKDQTVIDLIHSKLNMTFPTPVNLDSLSVDELIEMGDKFCREENDYQKGILFYSKAIESGYSLAEIYKKRGAAYFASKDFEKAIIDFTAAIAENPENIAEMYFMRGLSKSLLPKEDQKGACKDFRTSKTLGYDLSSLNGLNDYCGVNDLE